MTCNCCLSSEYWSLLYNAHLHPYWRESDWTPTDIDPRTSTITVLFYGETYERWIRHIVWQYDEGLKLNLLGIPTESVSEVQWANEDGSTIVVETPTTVTIQNTDENGDVETETCSQVDIPDSLLTEAGTIYGYVVTRTETSHVTIARVVITVNARAKTAPETTEATCCETLTAQIEALEARIAALEGTSEESTEETTTDP